MTQVYISPNDNYIPSIEIPLWRGAQHALFDCCGSLGEGLWDSRLFPP